jgi:hypothetical protein
MGEGTVCVIKAPKNSLHDHVAEGYETQKKARQMTSETDNLQAIPADTMIR